MHTPFPKRMAVIRSPLLARSRGVSPTRRSPRHPIPPLLLHRADQSPRHPLRFPAGFPSSPRDTASRGRTKRHNKARQNNRHERHCPARIDHHLRSCRCLRCGVSGKNFVAGHYELCGRLRDDCIAVAPQQPHATGNPMSQRECSGFNAPRLSVEAFDDVAGIPMTAWAS